MAPWLDDPAKPAQDRWTAVVAGDLRRLNGCAHKGQPRDAFPSDLPWLDQGVSEALGDLLHRLEDCWNQLQAIERVRAEPITIAPGSLSAYSGELDAAEAAALIQLGERDIWGVDELPETIDADMLRCLDRHSMIQARIVLMQNVAKFRGDRTPPKPSPQKWYSPIRDASREVDWDAVFTRHLGDRAPHPSQIRLTDVGKAERARILRRTSAASADDAALTDGAAAVVADEVIASDSPERAEPDNELDGITEKTFLSESDLAHRFDIPQSTLRGKLSAWRPKHLNNDWIPVRDRRPTDPQFLYRVLSVYPVIEAIRRSRRGSA